MAKRNNFNSENRLNRHQQRTINDIYEQLAILVDKVAENRHIETMEAFQICNRMLSNLIIEDMYDRYSY